MLVERDDNDENNIYFTRRLSFTEKTKQCLELYRRRSLQQANCDGRLSILTHIYFT